MGYPNYVDSLENFSMRRAAMYAQMYSRVDNDLIHDYYDGIPGTGSAKTAALEKARSVNEVGISLADVEDVLNNDNTLADEKFSEWRYRNIKSATLPGDANKFMIYFDWRNYSAAVFRESMFSFRMNTIGRDSSNGTVFDSVNIGDLLNDPITAGGLAAGPSVIPNTGGATYSSLYSCRTWADHTNLGNGEVAQAGRFYDLVSGYNTYIEDSTATGLPMSFSVNYEFESDTIYYTEGTGDEAGIWKPSVAGMQIQISLIFKNSEAGLVGTNFKAFGWSGDWAQPNSTIHPSVVPSKLTITQAFSFPIYGSNPGGQIFNSSDAGLTMVYPSLGRTTMTFGPAIGGYNIEDFYDPMTGAWAYPEIATSFANPAVAGNNGTNYIAHHLGVGVETKISYI